MTVAAPGAAVKDITQISRTYNWDTMKGYGRGIWAPCLTFNPGNHRFYVHFADPDFGIFMAWTDDITKNQWHDLQASSWYGSEAPRVFPDTCLFLLHGNPKFCGFRLQNQWSALHQIYQSS